MTALKSRLRAGLIGATATALATFTTSAMAANLKLMFQGDPYEIDAIKIGRAHV